MTDSFMPVGAAPAVPLAPAVPAPDAPAVADAPPIPVAPPCVTEAPDAPAAPLDPGSPAVGAAPPCAAPDAPPPADAPALPPSDAELEQAAESKTTLHKKTLDMSNSKGVFDTLHPSTTPSGDIPYHSGIESVHDTLTFAGDLLLALAPRKE
ncbi:MAG: hypothetical protein ABI548_14095 [Polyangiaceae bacterium]